MVNEFKCLKCATGYFLDNDETCKACVDGCSFCVNDKTCPQNGCSEGYTRDRKNGTCISCISEGVANCDYESATSEYLIPLICKLEYVLNKKIPPNICESK